MIRSLETVEKLMRIRFSAEVESLMEIDETYFQSFVAVLMEDYAEKHKLDVKEMLKNIYNARVNIERLGIEF